MDASNHHEHQRNGPRRSGLFLVLLDVALLIVALNVFALFHHVLPMKLTPAGDTPPVAAAAGSDAPMSGGFSGTFPAEDTGKGALYGD